MDIKNIILGMRVIIVKSYDGIKVSSNKERNIGTVSSIINRSRDTRDDFLINVLLNRDIKNEFKPGEMIWHFKPECLEEFIELAVPLEKEMFSASVLKKKFSYE